MKYHHIKLALLAILGMFLASACTMAKLEARLEANPQCKDIINPKTGALMPCPETDKAFYRSVGLEPAKPSPVAPAVAAATTQSAATVNSSAAVSQATPQNTPGSVTKPATQPPVTSNTPAAQVECKPQIHKKTGGMLPCPVAD